jgi:hypothetical protein
LQAFLGETDLPHDAVDAKPGDWNLEQILREKVLYDQNLNFEKGPDTVAAGWTTPFPAKAVDPDNSVPANALAVTVDTTSKSKRRHIAASFVNNTLDFWHGTRPYTWADLRSRGKNNVLSMTIIDGYLVTGRMDGSLDFYHSDTTTHVKQVQAHTSYVNQVVSTWDADQMIIATAGWDKKISVIAPVSEVAGQDQNSADSRSQQQLSLGHQTYTTSSNVQSVLFARHPDTNALYIVFTRRDSIHLHYLLLEPSTQTDATTRYTIKPSGRQLLAPQQHSTWTSFTPSHIEACPTDPTLIAVATSHTPSMKVIITRLLFPTESGSGSIPNGPTSVAYGTKDELAIRLVVNTNAPQNDYSTPRITWRPDGSGVWVSGDDGVVRGIDASTGKVVQQLKGHEQGTKIRCLWAGKLPDEDSIEKEVLISGGFDKKLIIWETE